MCKALSYTQKIISVLEEEKKERKRNYEIVHQCDLKTCDLLHELELHDVKGMYHAWQIMKELKEVRIARRKAKDELETLKLLDDFINNELKNCENVIGDIISKEDILKNRHYNIRSDCKLTNLNV